MKTVKRLGLLLLTVSALALIVYGVFELIAVLFQDTSIPLIIKLGIAGVIIGIILIIIALVFERIKDKKNEKF